MNEINVSEHYQISQQETNKILFLKIFTFERIKHSFKEYK